MTDCELKLRTEAAATAVARLRAARQEASQGPRHRQGNTAINKMTFSMEISGTRKTSTTFTLTSAKGNIQKTVAQTPPSRGLTIKKKTIFTRPTPSRKQGTTSRKAEARTRPGLMMIHLTERRSMARQVVLGSHEASELLTTTTSGEAISLQKVAAKERRAAISIMSGLRSRRKEVAIRIPTSTRSRGRDIGLRRTRRGEPSGKPSTGNISQTKAQPSTLKTESSQISKSAALGKPS